jgi:hypothetical protein
VQHLPLKCLACSKVYVNISNDNIYSILGIGWCMAINSFFVNIYYNVIIAWCLFYFFASFRQTLQWSDCGNWWNTARCSKIGYSINIKSEHYLIFIYSLDQSLNSTLGVYCVGTNQSSNCTTPILPPEEYFE